MRASDYASLYTLAPY